MYFWMNIIWESGLEILFLVYLRNAWEKYTLSDFSVHMHAFLLRFSIGFYSMLKFSLFRKGSFGLKLQPLLQIWHIRTQLDCLARVNAFGWCQAGKFSFHKMSKMMQLISFYKIVGTDSLRHISKNVIF